MDEITVVSKFVRGIISKLLKTLIHKKMGYNVDIQLNGLTATIKDGKTHIHFDVEAELGKEDLMKILKNIGLDK